MGRLIEADAVYKILESCEIKKDTYGSLLNDWDHGYNCGIERAESEIECAPTVEAEPVKHSRWIYGEDEYGIDGYFCEKCRKHVKWDYQHYFINFIEKYEYCPYCGAKMDAPEAE